MTLFPLFSVIQALLRLQEIDSIYRCWVIRVPDLGVGLPLPALSATDLEPQTWGKVCVLALVGSKQLEIICYRVAYHTLKKMQDWGVGVGRKENASIQFLSFCEGRSPRSVGCCGARDSWEV